MAIEFDGPVSRWVDDGNKDYKIPETKVMNYGFNQTKDVPLNRFERALGKPVCVHFNGHTFYGIARKVDNQTKILYLNPSLSTNPGGEIVDMLQEDSTIPSVDQAAIRVLREGWLEDFVEKSKKSNSLSGSGNKPRILTLENSPNVDWARVFREIRSTKELT